MRKGPMMRFRRAFAVLLVLQCGCQSYGSRAATDRSYGPIEAFAERFLVSHCAAQYDPTRAPKTTTSRAENANSAADRAQDAPKSDGASQN
jgi:hypothetical protein